MKTLALITCLAAIYLVQVYGHHICVICKDCHDGCILCTNSTDQSTKRATGPYCVDCCKCDCPGKENPPDEDGNEETPPPESQPDGKRHILNKKHAGNKRHASNKKHGEKIHH